MTLTPLVGEDEPGVQQADERRALGVELADDGLGDLAGDQVDELLLAAEPRAEPGKRRVRAHAAGVGAVIAVEQALVVLGGAEGQHVVAVAEEEERDLGSGEELLDEHRAERQVRVGVGERRVAVVGDDHALAGGEAVGLHDIGGAEVVERGLDLGAGGGAHGAAGGHARGIHDPLRERLRALELRGRLARTEHRDAARAQRVGDAGDERRLGPDHDEVDGVLVREHRDRGRVVRVEGDERRILRDAGVAGGGEDLVRRPPPSAGRG